MAINFPEGTQNFPGRIIQVQAAYNESQQSSTGSWTTCVSKAITPVSASNKILVTFAGCFGTSIDTYGGLRIIRGSSQVGTSSLRSGGGASVGYSVPVDNRNNPDAGWESRNASIIYLDSPSTTSAITYYIQFIRAYGGQINSNRPYNTNNAGYHWNGTCNIALYEVEQ